MRTTSSITSKQSTKKDLSKLPSISSSSTAMSNSSTADTVASLQTPLLSDYSNTTINTDSYEERILSLHPSTHSITDMKQPLKEQKKLDESSTRSPTKEHKKADNESLTLQDILIKSTLANRNQTKQARNVVAAFNQDIAPNDLYILPTTARPGFRIPPDEFFVAHMNNVPELAMARENGERSVERIIGPYTAGGIIARVKQTSPFFGINGVWVLNVPQGQYAKAWSGLQPQLYGEGVHVIQDSNFKFDPARDFVNASESFIAHGTIRILRVSPGQIARLIIDNDPVLLNYRKDPYIFNTPLFTFDPVKDFLSTTAPYIQNGTTHIVRVPAGYVAKVWIGSEPILLEYKKESYTFTDPLFSFEKITATQLFEKADAKLIIHGAIKRIIPPINEVAITNKDGKLEIIDRSAIITSPTHQVVGFLNTGIQTLEFPSASAREKKIHEDKEASPDQINYETYQTRDGLGVGVKLLVAYKIDDPTKALSQLTSAAGIVAHIEGLTTTDMGKTIQQLSSIDFLSSNQRKLNEKEIENKNSFSTDSPMPSAPIAESYADKAAKQLAKDLLEYGIELIRLNVQEFKILDKQIQAKMSEQALATTNASTQQTVTDLETIIKRGKAHQEAEVKSIIVRQENETIVSKAQAEVDAAKLRAEAKQIEAETDLCILKQKGELFTAFPILGEIQKFTILSGLNSLTVTPLQFANLVNHSGITFDNETSSLPRKKKKDEKERNLDKLPIGTLSHLSFLSNSSSSDDLMASTLTTKHETSSIKKNRNG